ncbi:MAG TPA: hypothetical protein VGQ49_05555 [Bryobacteraceae bacterium]|jgi:hypothetical protein|nr:hypothetical protein [Bryobacteraceae bacterium]
MSELKPRYNQYGGLDLEGIVQALDGEAAAGSDTYTYIENILSARIAKVIFNGLTFRPWRRMP